MDFVFVHSTSTCRCQTKKAEKFGQIQVHRHRRRRCRRRLRRRRWASFDDCETLWILHHFYFSFLFSTKTFLFFKTMHGGKSTRIWCVFNQIGWPFIQWSLIFLQCVNQKRQNDDSVREYCHFERITNVGSAISKMMLYFLVQINNAILRIDRFVPHKSNFVSISRCALLNNALPSRNRLVDVTFLEHISKPLWNNTPKYPYKKRTFFLSIDFLATFLCNKIKKFVNYTIWLWTFM